MNNVPLFDIGMSVRCPQCRKLGALVVNGKAADCLRCMAKNLKAGKYDHILKKPAPTPTGEARG